MARIPKYVGNIPGWVAYHKSLPAVVRDTYTQARGLAWSKNEIKITLEELEEATGKSQSTLYEHLRLLELCKALRWSITNGVAILKFEDAAPDGLNSRNSEVPFKDVTSLKLNVNSLRKLKKENSENSESWSEKGRELAHAYAAWLGYDPGDAAPVDADAIEWLANNFTIEQIETVYELNKASDFWIDKQLRPKHLRTQVPEYYAAGQRRSKNATHFKGEVTHTNRPDAEQLERDRALKRQQQG